jgi:hypothetical protein
MDRERDRWAVGGEGFAQTQSRAVAGKLQVPPLRFAPVGMTSAVDNFWHD